MFENEAKGWYGSYSVAGRNSAEKYAAIVHKDEIFKNERKKIKIKDIFTPDEEEPRFPIENNLDIFKVYSSSKSQQQSKSMNLKSNTLNFKPQTSIINKFIKPDKFKYHNLHCQNEEEKIKYQNKKKDCSLSKYYPKYEYIWPRLLTGPIWEKNRGRVYPKKIIDNRSFAIIKDPYESKMLVNMNKTTQRGEFSEMKDVRIRTDKPYDHNYNNNNKKKYNTKLIKKNIKPLQTENISNSDNNNNNLNSKNTLTSFKTYQKNNLSKSKIIKSKINAPNFDLFISRAQVDKAKNPKLAMVPFIIPNYSQVYERSLTMAVYDQPKRLKSKIKYFHGMDPGINFDPDKVIDKVNNHVIIKPPNFKLMTSRPEKKNSPLPSFMMGLHDRESVNKITEKTLKLNSFSEGKLSNAHSTFWPKKSFNNIINLNFVNSNKFKEKDFDEDLEQKKEFLKTRMNFYHKNYDALIKEGALNKFDNVTYKTIKHEHKIDPAEMEKYLINFDNVDAN